MKPGIRSLLLLTCTSISALGQQADPNTIKKEIGTLRQLSAEKRSTETRDLALSIRSLPAGRDKVVLANTLAHLATEGQDNLDVIQQVATTLSSSLKETPIPSTNGKPSPPYDELAKLVRYEGVTSDLDDPQYTQSMDLLKANDAEAEKLDFTLEGLNLKPLGVKKVTLSQFRGKIVVVNFWATWCPPCRAEMPDLAAIYDHFKDQMVVFSITDEEPFKVASFVSAGGLKYPILLDPGRKVNNEFHVDGIPQTFVYDRDGKLVGHAMDMRTQRQFLTMLAKAGLKPE
jgi:thiol-disulfide isomerase/thioredoxin